MISPSFTGLEGAEDSEVGCIIVEMSQLQPSLHSRLGLQYSLKLGFKMGDLKVEVQ
jgi:hypothetical protein